MKLQSHRLRTLRLSRGLSLDGLSIAMGGLVSKQALSKYEKGSFQPSSSVMVALAEALGASTSDLLVEQPFQFERLEFRKKSALGKKAAEAIQSTIEEEFNRRLQLQSMVPGEKSLSIPIQKFQAKNPEEAEEAAKKLRSVMELGTDPIGNLTAVLEEHAVHVITVDAPPSFDGFSMIGRRSDGSLLSAAVAGRSGVFGDRQRLTIAHELGHLVFEPIPRLVPKENEQLAFRFGAAFLMPENSLKAELGSKRTSLNLQELLILKHRFGVSIQALVRRARDTEVISEPTYKSICMQISRMGWRTKEPGIPIPPEQSTWTRQTALRAWTEGLLSETEVKNFLGEIPGDTASSSLMRKRKFLELTQTQQNKILAEEARKLENYYSQETDWDTVETEGWE
jgi:transcriptional regulator with XRE-family HTH domain